MTEAGKKVKHVSDNPFLDPKYEEPKDRLKRLVAQSIGSKPFSELSTVAFHHDGSTLAGHVLLDTLEEQGFSLDDFDAVGALTAAAVPFVIAMISAASARGQKLDGFVLDFVFPGIKGPQVEGKKVVVLDAWLSEKSYIQTSSLVTLKKGNELNLDFAILNNLGAQVVAIAALVGGIGSFDVSADDASINVVSPVDGSEQKIPFVSVFDEAEVTATGVEAIVTEGDVAVSEDSEELGTSNNKGLNE